MNTKVVIAVTAVASFAAGGVAGWFLRKRQEIEFVETTEEDLQAYAEQFENKDKESPEDQDNQEEQDPEITVDVIRSDIDTRKIDYANAWKEHQKIVKREGYGEPGPGDPEDLEPTEDDLHPQEEDEEGDIGPRYRPITGTDFYKAGEKGLTQEVYFWYDRDDVITEQEDDEEETVVEEVTLQKLGLDIRNEFKTRKDDIEEEIAGTGLFLYLKDTLRDVVISLVRYPMSYKKRAEQEAYGGTEELVERIRRRNGPVY